MPTLSKLPDNLRSIVSGNNQYEPDLHIPEAHRLALTGLTFDMIAAKLGISMSTFTKWVGTADYVGWYPELREAILAGQRVYDAKMIDTMDAIAHGRLKTEDGEIDVKAALKAIEFWFPRRMRKDFSESQIIDIASAEENDPAALVWEKIKAERLKRANSELKQEEVQ